MWALTAEWERPRCETSDERYAVRLIFCDTYELYHDVCQRLVGVGCLNEPLWKALPCSACHDCLPTIDMLYDVLKHLLGATLLKPKCRLLLTPLSEVIRFLPVASQTTLLLDMLGRELPSRHVRVYVPLLGRRALCYNTPGLKGHPHALHLSADHDEAHRVIVTTSQLAAMLPQSTSVCPDVTTWIELFGRAQLPESIATTSQTIAGSYANTNPDNAFQFVVCHSARSLVMEGLGLSAFKSYTAPDDVMWQTLLGHLGDCATPSEVLRKRWPKLDVNKAEDVLVAWLDASGAEANFERWLLEQWQTTQHADDYLTLCLTGAQLPQRVFDNVMVRVFADAKRRERWLPIRQRLAEVCEENGYYHCNTPLLTEQLEELRKTSTAAALRHITGHCREERPLLLSWLAEGYITIAKLETHYPTLAHYFDSLRPHAVGDLQWLAPYFDAYRSVRLHGKLNDEYSSLLQKHNATASLFHSWSDDASLCDTPTWLHKQGLTSAEADESSLHWVDGLGLDWLPLLTWLISQHNSEGVAVLSSGVARALLPTTTEANRTALEKVANGNLPKTGDLDSSAHTKRDNLEGLCADIDTVVKLVDSVCEKAKQGRVVIVSDHGLSYAPQYGTGLNLGVTGHHNGRYALASEWEKNTGTGEDRSCVSSGEWLCSLRLESFTAKHPDGQGAHGGALPEEVLVPVVVLGPGTGEAKWTATLIDTSLQAGSIQLRVAITGLPPANVTPQLEVNNSYYTIEHTSGEVWEMTAPLALRPGEKLTVVVWYGSERSATMSATVQSGAEEDEDFLDF